MIDIASAGALVLLAKNLVDTLKTLGDAIGGRRRGDSQQDQYDELVARLGKFNARLEILAKQLEQSERLTRMVPAWLEIAGRMPFWSDANELEAVELQRIDRELRQLVFDSIRDHFSATFFKADFSLLPAVERTITEFRTLLTEFERTLSSIPAGNLDAFRGLWGSLSTQFNSVKNKAWELQQTAEEIQGELVREIGEAASTYASFSV